MSILKETEWQTCDECGLRKRVADEQRGCDVCKRVFDDQEPYLSSDIFRRGTNGADRLDFCSWTCALKGLAAVETDYFVSLPYLHYDKETPVKQRAEGFFRAVRAFAESEHVRS